MGQLILGLTSAMSRVQGMRLLIMAVQVSVKSMEWNGLHLSGATTSSHFSAVILTCVEEANDNDKTALISGDFWTNLEILLETTPYLTAVLRIHVTPVPRARDTTLGLPWTIGPRCG